MTSIRALSALFFTILLWSYQAIAAKYAIKDVPGLPLLFLRMSFAACAFFPFFLREKPWKSSMFSSLALVSILASINTTGFLLGIGYTSASVSQLIYAAMPICVVIGERIMQGKRHSTATLIGVGLGFLGIGLIVYLSLIEGGKTITGTLHGNLFIVVAMIAWTLYIFFSKKYSVHFSPLAIGSTSVLINWVVSFIGAALYSVIVHPVFHVTPLAWWGAGYMGIFGTFLAYVCYQYGIRHSTPLTVSMTSYIQPVITGLMAMYFLGEKMTRGYVIGTVLIFSGIFLSTTVGFLEKKRSSMVD